MKKFAILPVYNEEKTVINVLNKLKQYVDIIIVVNDSSTDNSDFLIRKWMNKKESNYCIGLKKNKEMATALKQGLLRKISGSILIFRRKALDTMGEK